MIRSVLDHTMAKAAAFVCGAALALTFIATPAQAATLSYTDTSCSAFTVTGTAPNFTLVCSKASCSISPSPSANPTPGTAVTLTETCSPAATAWTWQLVSGPSGCPPAPAPNTSPAALSPTPTTTTTGCLYEVDVTAPQAGSAQITINWSAAPPVLPSGCTLTPTSTSLPAGGGPVTLFAKCTAGDLPITHTLHGGPFEGLSAQQASLATAVQFGPVTVTASTSVNDHATNTAGAASPDPTASITVASSGGLANCTNQGFTVIPSSGPTNAPWGSGGTWQSTQSGNFGDNTVWLFSITPPAGTAPSATLGRFAISEFSGPITSRQLTISTTPCDFRNRDYTGANGPIGVSNGTTASIIYGVCAPQFFGGNACMTAGTTYYVSARNWQLDPTPQVSCGQTSCNAIMNDQPASP
jgi:hypothetical protein